MAPDAAPPARATATTGPGGGSSTRDKTGPSGTARARAVRSYDLAVIGGGAGGLGAARAGVRHGLRTVLAPDDALGGNFPQVFSHVGLVNSTFNLAATPQRTAQ